jgi:ADP-ribose pyrophosphatase YjhB (NUDIX family)
MTDPSDPAEIILKERRKVFANSKFNVFSDHIVDDAGREIKDYLVVAPKQSADDLVSGVAILPIYKNKVVLLKTFRHAIRRALLEVPRGFIDSGENPAEAAVRELTEETGLMCSTGRLVDLGICSPEAGMIAARVALFAALDCEAGTRTDELEMGLGKCVSFSPQEAEHLLQQMVLEDVTTALCLHRYFLKGFVPGRQPAHTGL